MTCQRAREIDLAAYLVEPGTQEHRGFREHYPTCRECSTELARWTLLEDGLRDLSDSSPHPADELLLAYRRTPESLSATQREELAAHVGSCPPCRDAVGAVVGLDLERLLAQPQTKETRSGATDAAGPWAALANRLAGWLDLSAPAWAAICVALLVVGLGLPWLMSDSPVPEPPVAHIEAPVVPETPPIPEPEPAPREQLAEVAPEAVAPTPEPERLAEMTPPEPAPPAPEPLAPKPERLAELAPEPAPPAPAPKPAPPAPRKPLLITALGPEPIRFLPRAGMPAGRVAGGTRGTGPKLAQPLALVPESVGLTLVSQPSLYWFLPEASSGGVRIDVSDIDSMKSVLTTTLRGPLQAGVQVLRLGAHGVKLVRDRNYQWMLTAVGTDAPASGGIVRRIGSEPKLAAALDQADPGSRLRILATNGIWYDALDLLSRSIAARPGDAQLRQGRAQLLEQQGLSSAAAWDRTPR